MEKANNYGIRTVGELIDLTAHCCFFPEKEEYIFQGNHCPVGKEHVKYLRIQYNIRWGVPKYMKCPTFYIGVGIRSDNSITVYSICNRDNKCLLEVLDSDTEAWYVKLPLTCSIYDIFEYLKLLPYDIVRKCHYNNPLIPKEVRLAGVRYMISNYSDRGLLDLAMEFWIRRYKECFLLAKDEILLRMGGPLPYDDYDKIPEND